MTWLRVDLSAPEFALPTEPPITCGLIYRGKRHGLSGPPEAAKTLAALIFGLEHMRAGHGAFAFVDFEMGEHATRLMLEELGATADEIAAVYYVSSDGPPAETDIEALAAAGVTFVIVDAAAGAYDASGLDDNKRADAERFARLWVTPLWRRGITTLTLDHVVKNADNRGRYAIGSERKLGAVDVHLGLEATTQLHRGGNGLVKISVHKDRPAHLRRPHAADLHLTSDPVTHRIAWRFQPVGPRDTETATGFRPTCLMERVSRFLEIAAEPTSRSKIENGVKGNARYVRDAIDALITDGYAGEADGARRARLVHSITPYRELDPVLTPSIAETNDPVHDPVHDNPHNHASNGTPSDLVPTPSASPSPDPVQVPAPSKGPNSRDEVDEDEVERLFSKHGDLV